MLAAYGDLLAGRVTPAEGIARAERRPHYGVSRRADGGDALSP